MSGSLQYATIQSGKEVLTDLYREDTDLPYFVCRISVPGVLPDSVEYVAIALYVTRTPHKPHSYQLANGDRIYRTEARIDPQGEPFDIDVIVRHQGANVNQATISVSSDVNNIITRHRK